MKNIYMILLSAFILFSLSCKSTTDKSTIVISIFPNYTTYLTSPENENPKQDKTKETKSKDIKKTSDNYSIKETERGNVLVFEEKVLFYFQSLKMKPESVQSLKYVKDFMTEYPDVKIIIEGHTDKYGKSSYNYKLANKRASQGVKNLTALGIQKSRLIPRSIGSKIPEYKTNPENRRLEFVIIKNDDDLKKYESYMKKHRI